MVFTDPAVETGTVERHVDQDTAHGERATYKRGCRCLPCRSANAVYVRARRLAPATELGMVPVVEASAHLGRLRDLGVGYRQAAALSGLSIAEIRAVRAQKWPYIKEATAASILAIRPVLAHGQRVSAWPTWRLLYALEREGFTLGALALRLGLHGPGCRVDHERVRVSTALRVRRFHAAVTAEGPEVTA